MIYKRIYGILYSNVMKSSTPNGIPKYTFSPITITPSNEAKKFAESSKFCLLTEFASRARTCPI